jgi:hypothetical protein
MARAKDVSLFEPREEQLADFLTGICITQRTLLCRITRQGGRKPQGVQRCTWDGY